MSGMTDAEQERLAETARILLGQLSAFNHPHEVQEAMNDVRNALPVNLLPCPFCGGAHDLAIEQGRMGYGHRVRCRSCNARAGEGCTQQGAANRWNRRTGAGE